jgi:hypothetical protein
MVVRGSGWRAAIWTSRTDAGVEHGGDEGVPEHVRVHSSQVHAGRFGEPAQPSGGAVPVHAGGGGGQQDRSAGPVVDGSFQRASDGGWERYEYDFVALAVYPQYAVAVFLAEVFDVAADGLEDAQPQQAEHGDEDAVAAVGRRFGGGEQRFELQVSQPRVGDSAGTLGRRTHSADECSSTASMTQVR